MLGGPDAFQTLTVGCPILIPNQLKPHHHFSRYKAFPSINPTYGYSLSLSLSLSLSFSPYASTELIRHVADTLAIHRSLLYPALPPKIDENHPTWLHLQIREFDPSSDESKTRSHHPNISNHKEGGRWTLGFPDAKACNAARLLILEEVNKQRSSVESLLAPLLQDISENSTHCQEE